MFGVITLKKQTDERIWKKFYDDESLNIDYPNCSIYKLLEKSAQDHLNYISYDYFGKKKTFKAFLKQINKCAKSFKRLGVQKGDYVSICMPNTPEAIISFYALNKIGAVANMIHPLSAENEIKYYLNVSESNYVVALDSAFNKINHIIDETRVKNVILVSPADSMPFFLKIGYKLTRGRKTNIEYNKCIIKWRKFMRLSLRYWGEIKDDFDGDETAVVLYSGGTTGDPKGIMLSNYNFNSGALQSFYACGKLEAGDKCLAILPIFHAFGLGVCIHTVQYFGGTSILIPQFDAKEFDNLLKKYKPNIIIGVPTLYEAFLKNEEINQMDLSFLKLLISGGDTLSISLKKKVDDFLHERGAVNIQVREGYGLTESSGASCLTPYYDYRAGSIGIPYPGTLYKIVKHGTNREVKHGKEGEIAICGPSVMQGYLKDPEQTNKVLKPDKEGRIWLHTGDMGSMDDEGFVYFKNRLKRMIVSSGYNLYPQYIEGIIESHPDVLRACVIGVPHPYKVQVAKAFIVLEDGVPKNDKILDSIKELCERNLARYSWPHEYEFRDKLPKTLIGKIAYTKLEEEEKKKRDNEI